MINIKNKTKHGVIWAGASQAIRILTQLLSVLILSRLLAPEDYGLMAMASVVTGFAMLFRDLGTTAALIQKENPSKGLKDSIFWLNIAIAIILATVLLAIRNLVAKAFSEPRISEIMWTLTVPLIVISFSSVHQAIIERAVNFKRLALIEILASLVGFFVAITSANLGCGVYSFINQAIAISFVSTCLLWASSGWRPGLSFKIIEIRLVASFGGNLVGFNVFNYFIRNADNWIIGRYLGATELGYYSIAYKLMLWPLQNISSVAMRALFPIFSRMQEGGGDISNAYVSVLRSIIFITAPAMFILFILREEFVRIALGDNWLPVAEILGWLTPVGLLQSIGTTVGTIYFSTGRTDIMFRWGVLTGLIVVPIFFIGLSWGIVGVAIAYAIYSVLVFIPGLMVPFKLINLNVCRVIKNIIPAIISSVITAIIVYGVKSLLYEFLSVRHNFIVCCFVAVFVYIYISSKIQREQIVLIRSVVFGDNK